MNTSNPFLQYATSFLHITINTGHVCQQHANAVDLSVIEYLKPHLERALTTGEPFKLKPFGDRVFISVSRHAEAYLVELFTTETGERYDFLTFGVSLNGNEGAAVWNYLHSSIVAPSTTPPLPSEPWIAVRLEPMSILLPNVILLAGDFERCAAFALRAIQTQCNQDAPSKRTEYVTEGVVLNLEDGTRFDFNRECGPTLRINITAPTEDEIKEIRRGKARFGLVQINGVLFLLAKFGNLPWLDAPFHVGLYEPHLRGVPDEWVSGLRLNLAVQVIHNAPGQGTEGGRLMTLSPEFSSMLVKLVRRQAVEPISRQAYDEVINDTYRAYPSATKLAKFAFISCVGGE